MKIVKIGLVTRFLAWSRFCWFGMAMAIAVAMALATGTKKFCMEGTAGMAEE